MEPVDFKKPFEELTQMQLQYGYKEGELSPVALLGLFGEAGEILDEIIFYDLDGDENEKRKALAVGTAKLIDELKKHFRDHPHFAPGVIIKKEFLDNGAALDLEIADTLYYLVLIALGRGRDLSYYAQLSIDKVKAKGLKPPEPAEPVPHLYMNKDSIKDFLDSQHDPGDEHVKSQKYE